MKINLVAERADGSERFIRSLPADAEQETITTGQLSEARATLREQQEWDRRQERKPVTSWTPAIRVTAVRTDLVDSRGKLVGREVAYP